MRASSLLNSTAILLLDGAGALLTALGVGLVLPALQPMIGLPVATLRVLGAVALLFALFSLGRHFSGTGSAASLRQIAVANLCYCVVTAGLLFGYAGEVTPLGYSYFIAEIIIVVVLSARELWVASRLVHRQ